ncbi:protein kinase domain-containing protein [Nocardioides perillae]|uniref:non-specific serine/threonine protein kinase n=1 Tax=Nocardioides perillae TaxID=1119534 RepID=A0A7Y9RQ05_9ACTN|nr:serine/threonine-protein kinase [Nocardioides perillae]
MTTPAGPRTVDPAGRYALESRIATGGMGEVWRARDTVLDRAVAVKLLKPEYADDATFRARFETEARHAAALHHPHVAAVYDFGETAADDGSGVPRPYLVMELVDGQPLSALLRPGQPMAATAVTGLLAQAADAIGAAHAAGIVHRDVKPANLLVTPDRQVKITDFGIARAAEGMALTQTGQVMGTPQYFSPEQAQGAPASPASDVYSLGVVAFECLAGRRPFDGPTPVAAALAHVREPVPDLPAAVPADLATVVRTCLAKDPADRFADGAALAAALRDPATAATAIVAGGPDDDRTRVVPGLVAGAAGAGAVGAGVAGAVGPAAAGTAPTAVVPGAASTGATPLGGGRGAGSGEGPGERPGDGAGRRTAVVALVLLLVVAAAVAALLLAGRGDDDEPTDAPTTAGPTERPSPTATASEDTSVLVDPDDYVGRPLDEVVADLRSLGLEVREDEVDNPGGEEPGIVTAVDPAGDLEEGDRVTVSYWGPEPDPVEEPDEEEPDEEEPQEPAPTPEPTPSPEPTEAPAPTEPTDPATEGDAPADAPSEPAAEPAPTTPAARTAAGGQR